MFIKMNDTLYNTDQIWRITIEFLKKRKKAKIYYNEYIIDFFDTNNRIVSHVILKNESNITELATYIDNRTPSYFYCISDGEKIATFINLNIVSKISRDKNEIIFKHIDEMCSVELPTEQEAIEHFNDLPSKTLIASSQGLLSL